ncbi:hypothetical protein SAMN04488004_1366 [Loktanella salsilacus]|uniref:Uncharacterized protein n=1 Tax=Loktanella salsilacus TaxID=195913 RepID=A0A1I4JET7_9RHOB|nr:hypothetical protein [Loktanella salsilacus]SFL64741.1 hypothetical protein SAMN04488004_1366 [Loktanella salsilacus]
MPYPDAALLNAPLTALTALAGAQGSGSGALPAVGLHLLTDPGADMTLNWSSPRGRLIEVTTTITAPGKWCVLRLDLDLPDLSACAGLGFWLRSAASPALVMQALIRSGTDDGHVDCVFERDILSHAAASDHTGMMLTDRTPDLPCHAPWRMFELLLPPYRPITLAIDALRLFPVPA